jgi:co-chaperonin GroES (HSP10)
MQLTPELEDVGRRVRVLRDRVLVKPLPYVHPTLLTPGIEIQKGVVIAVGYGRRKRRKVAFNQSSMFSGRTLYFEDGEETGEIVPMDIAPGDVIEFSFRNLTIVDFDRIGFPGIGDLVFVWRQSIYSIDPDESLNECLLWQQSAGYDRHGNFMSGAESWNRT